MTTATPAPHPSRATPKCHNCKHRFTHPFLPAGESRCDHPSTPVDYQSGFPVVTCQQMRTPSRVTLEQFPDLTFCGTQGALWERQSVTAPTTR
jgi:hypothetical protein